jgi:hypothetical protein
MLLIADFTLMYPHDPNRKYQAMAPSNVIPVAINRDEVIVRSSRKTDLILPTPRQENY